jgi:hypothetical protein
VAAIGDAWTGSSRTREAEERAQRLKGEPGNPEALSLAGTPARSETRPQSVSFHCSDRWSKRKRSANHTLAPLPTAC